MAENAQPIIIKKVKKGGGHGHHGGSWKVAYADFVTAMMAFFLLLWLLNVSNEEVLHGIAEYFQNPNIVHAAGGASTSVIKLGSHFEQAKGEGEEGPQNLTDKPDADLTEEFLEMEMRQLQDLRDELEYEIENSPALKPFKDQLALDITEEGLRIQIVDKDKRPMFDSGSSVLKHYTRKIIKQLTPILNKVPNRVSLSGHTDARRYYANEENTTNWELSADRANASRREMVRAGMPENKITRVVGMASQVPFNEADPYDSSNRRISIIVLNKKSERSILRAGQSSEGGARTPPPVLTPEELSNAIRDGAVRKQGSVVRFR